MYKKLVLKIENESIDLLLNKESISFLNYFLPSSLNKELEEIKRII